MYLGFVRLRFPVCFGLITAILLLYAGLGTDSALAAAPVCTNQNFTVESGEDLFVPIVGSCTDSDGPSPLQGQIVAFPSHGSIGPGPDGGGIYRSSSGYTGPDSFTYRAYDGAELSNVATVTIDVTEINIPEGNLPPTCPASHAYVPVGESIVLRANCVDPDGDPIFYGLTAPYVTGGFIDQFTPNSVRYTPSPSTVSDVLGYSARDPFYQPINFVVSIEVTQPGQLTFDTAPEVNSTVPYAASVSSPSEGPVYIDNRALTTLPPSGFFLLEQEYDITAPDAVDPANPLSFVFKFDKSIVDDLEFPPDQVEVFRNGDVVQDCAFPGAGMADPTPCVEGRDPQGDGDLWITVLTMQASVWNFGRAEVVYDWTGFFRPVDNPDVLNKVSAGRAVPVKFSLSGDQGLDIMAEGFPLSRQVNCDNVNDGISDIIEETVNAGGSSLSYDSYEDQYNYVWKTQKNWAGTCRKLKVMLDDGELHTAYFKLTK